MGIKTTMAAVTYAPAHVTAAAKAAQDVNSLHQEVQEMSTELIIKLKRLVASMQTGDSNIATVNAQITALS